MSRNSLEGEVDDVVPAPAMGRSAYTTAASSSTAIPVYPDSNIAKPATNLGILQHSRVSQEAFNSAASARQSRMSLSYVDQTRPDRSLNASTSANVNIEERKGGSHRRSQSAVRTSMDAERSRPSNAFRRSISFVRRQGPTEPIDPMQEPRRSIGKRPNETGLAGRDPYNDPSKIQPGWWKHRRRAVPFAAPYEHSGVVIDQPATLRDWKIPGPLTAGTGQWLYLVLGQSLVAAIISGSINFGVAVALYRTQPRVRIWPFDQQTVAGDMGVTIIIQQIVSFIITSALVHHDLYTGPIGPLRRPWPPLLHLPSTPTPEGHWLGIRMPSDVPREKNNCRMGRSEGQTKLNGYFWWFVRAILTGSERNDLLATGISWRQRLERLIWTAAQGFFLCVLTFWWYWPIAIAIVAPIYEHRDVAGTWVPMIIKLLYGAILSLLTNPIMALMAMGAEVSVRRCYPELEIWQPFGGREDFVRWKIEQGVVDEAELGEVEGEQGEMRQESQSSGSLRAQDDAQAMSSEKPRHGAAESRHQHGNELGRRIAEEPGVILREVESEKHA